MFMMAFLEAFFNPLDPPFLLRRIFDLGGLEGATEGHPQDSRHSS
jgi:hypothetical protein